MPPSVNSTAEVFIQPDRLINRLIRSHSVVLRLGFGKCTIIDSGSDGIYQFPLVDILPDSFNLVFGIWEQSNPIRSPWRP